VSYEGLGGTLDDLTEKKDQFFDQTSVLELISIKFPLNTLLVLSDETYFTFFLEVLLGPKKTGLNSNLISINAKNIVYHTS